MAYIQYPRIADVPTPFGNVNLAFTSGDHVHVSTDAHVNDNRPTITLRGVDYLISLHLYRASGWTTTPPKGDSWSTVQRRDNWTPATPPNKVKITEAIEAVVQAYAAEHPEVLRAATYADANNRADDLEKEAGELREKLHRVSLELRAARRRMAASAPQEASEDTPS
jgi:hypothetical protein